MYCTHLVILCYASSQHYLFAFVNITIYIALCLGVDRCWSLSYIDPVDVPQVCFLIMSAIDAAF